MLNENFNMLTEENIIQIINGNVLTEHINMNIYKSGSLAIHNDRKKIFEYLEIIRQYFIID